MKDEFDAIATIVGRTVFPTTETAIVTGVYDKDVYVQLRGSQRHVQVIVPRESGVQAGDEVIVAKSPRPSLERRWHIVGIGKAFDSGGGGADPGVTPHALSGASHTGTLVNAQGPQFPLLDGSRQLTANWDVGPFQVRAETLQSDVATGTAPLTVASTTLVNNLNVGLLGGFAAADYPRKAENATISGGWDFPGGGFTIGSDVLLQRSAANVLATPDTLQVPTITAIANLTLQPAGDLILDPTGLDVLPDAGYEINLGSLQKKYLTLHAAELWVETLVAQNTIATIGGRILVGPTTVLTRDLGDGAGDTTVYVKHNQMAWRDITYMEADGKVEFFQMASVGALQPEGDYAYDITRDLDLSGRNLWFAGDAMFNTGSTTSGFIDIYSVRGVKSATQYGPTIVGNARLSYTYNDWVEHWAIGNLNGLYGYSTNTYGVGLGRYSTGYSNVVIDPRTSFDGGIRFRNYDVTIAQWVGNTITLGQTGAGNDYIQIDPTNGIRMFVDNTQRLSLAADGTFWLGESGTTERLAWDTTNGLRIFNAANAEIIKFPVLGNAQIVGTLAVSSPGQITAGSGNVTLDTDGISLIHGTSLYNQIKFFYGTTRVTSISSHTSSGFSGTQLALSAWGPNISYPYGTIAIVADDYMASAPVGVTIKSQGASSAIELMGAPVKASDIIETEGNLKYWSNLVPRRSSTDYTGYVPIGFYHSNRGSNLTLGTTAGNVFSIAASTLGNPPAGRISITACIGIQCTTYAAVQDIIVIISTGGTERSRMYIDVRALMHDEVTVCWTGAYTSGQAVAVQAWKSSTSNAVIATQWSMISIINYT